MLYSPINYQGNKSRIVDKILNFIPKDTTEIHEIFCGSAIVSLASNVKKIYLNDNNHYILDLVKYFKSTSAQSIIETADKLITYYNLTNTFYEGREKYPEEKHEGLSRFNKKGYEKLKSDYNKDKDINKLFLLVIYGFNHYLRFNGRDEFNVPVGKTDFVKILRQRTYEYCRTVQSKQIYFSNLDFRDKNLYKNKNAIYYFDPPYLITKTIYNNLWNKKNETDLLELIDKLNAKGYKFILSNVIESNGKENEILKDWMKKYNVHYIERQYLNSSYQKKNLSKAIEVLITNF